MHLEILTGIRYKGLFVKLVSLRISRHKVETRDNTIILTDIPTQDEMAFRIGTVREVLCRGLHKLERENLIKVKRGKVIIYDVNKLRDMMPEEEESLFPITLPMNGTKIGTQTF